ncbi:MAG: hypothetical protein IK122_00620 [Alphaproteobacteria bacterium]|nr:hypothetical protein [Alphaproteobacteria bacterium]
MKLSKILFGFMCGAFVFGANAADITIYYSPTCPHCHHAREFIENTLIYEYSDLKVTTVNVMDENNYPEFVETLKKCEYESGGVPVIVVGEKCFQGFGESSKPELRTAVEVDLSDEQKQAAATNKKEMEKDQNAFVAAHADRKNAVSEKETKKKITNKTENKMDITDFLLYGFLILLFAGMGLVLFKKQK